MLFFMYVSESLFCFFFLVIESSEQERRATAALKEEVQTLKEQITNYEDVVNVLKSMYYG